MKRALFFLLLAGHALADSTVDPDAALAWGGNAGEFNWRPSLADGVVTGEYVCSGMIWAANAGWINVGSGVPADGIRYQNDDGSDFGVNLLADGSLRGLAWGANIGWVNFEATGNPRIDFATGILAGYVWGANIGWVTLDGGGDHFVATNSIPAGADSDSDGITDAWELDHSLDLDTFTMGGDADADGIPDAAEYAADTDPLNPDAGLRITGFFVSADSTLISLTWTSRLSRRYVIEAESDLAIGIWNEGASEAIAADGDVTTSRQLDEPATAQRFYRVRAVRPLAP